MSTKSKADFSKRITLIIKGILIVWLIMHHALASKHFVDDGSRFVFIMSKLASRGAAVVAGFAFLSGYGLNETYKAWCRRLKKDASSSGGTLSGEPTFLQKIGFSYSRILRLLVNLWIIYVIFVGAILVFRNPDFLNEAYKGNILTGLVKNLSGNLLPLNSGTVNKSWWFIRAICSFYLIYPFVKCVDKKYALAVTVLSFAVTVPVLGHPQNTRIFWYFQFFLGYYISEIDLFGYLREKVRMPDLFIGSLLAFICTNYMMFRYFSYPLFPLWGLNIVFLMYSAYHLAPNLNILWKPFEVLGKYSSDMYLMHVFVHGQLLYGIIYHWMNPVWIVVSETLICLAFSWILAQVKNRTGLTARLGRLCPDKR